MKRYLTFTAFVITILVASMFGYEWSMEGREERQASWERGFHAGAQSMEYQCRMMPGCDVSDCQSMYSDYVREDENWVEYMLESCELDNIECQALGGCNPVVRDLSPWQETFVQTHEANMAPPSSLDVRPRVRLNGDLHE